ncbi:hypothetical protein AVEN_140376-1 [Araneus ventricosus]|uniref:Uncharacterized protein n=1 Tax=Araneus ventricosus TaxID=182803 RepID=A0A4Y2P3E7_ARAVE|nr:hypothetical protein AVEN_140376-1 [Araneus ventricosus]
MRCGESRTEKAIVVEAVNTEELMKVMAAGCKMEFSAIATGWVDAKTELMYFGPKFDKKSTILVQNHIPNFIRLDGSIFQLWCSQTISHKSKIGFSDSGRYKTWRSIRIWRPFFL